MPTASIADTVCFALTHTWMLQAAHCYLHIAGAIAEFLKQMGEFTGEFRLDLCLLLVK